MTKEEALAHLRDYAHGFYKGSTDRIPPHSFDLNRETTDILEAALLRDMQRRWIPCSERLPEKYGNYLVTTDDGEVDIGSCDPENKDRQDHFWSGCDADGFFWYGENIVIAWMPLPEPWRGEQE